ncbi:MAG: SPOUT family RNA methylase [Candidatus Aenigmatarchaeota archaeon]
MDLFLTCKLGLERVVASYIKDVAQEVTVEVSPMGFHGILLVCDAKDKYKLAELVKSPIPEVERVHIVEAVSKADIGYIVEAVSRVVTGRIQETETFAVRTVRRGKHTFTNIDVNVAVGSTIEKLTGSTVDLENPDKVVFINVLGDYAYISMHSGREFYRKMTPEKYPIYKLFRRLVVAHEPYLGPQDAAYTMGRRIGREAQVFEVGKLVVTPAGEVDAKSLYSFLKGLFEGIESRYRVQKKSYGRDVHKVEVSLQDMYQFVRSRFEQPLIVFEPEGEPVSKVKDEIAEFILEKIKSGKRVHVMVGAREGVPTGIFRYANFVLDVAPGVVISTDYALTSALIALATILHEKLLTERLDMEEEASNSGRSNP